MVDEWKGLGCKCDLDPPSSGWHYEEHGSGLDHCVSYLQCANGKQLGYRTRTAKIWMRAPRMVIGSVLRHQCLGKQKGARPQHANNTFRASIKNTLLSFAIGRQTLGGLRKALIEY